MSNSNERKPIERWISEGYSEDVILKSEPSEIRKEEATWHHMREVIPNEPSGEITDTERLDYYNRNSSAFLIEASGSVFSLWTEQRQFYPTLREAIDAAIRGGK